MAFSPKFYSVFLKITRYLKKHLSSKYKPERNLNPFAGKGCYTKVIIPENHLFFQDRHHDLVDHMNKTCLEDIVVYTYHGGICVIFAIGKHHTSSIK